MTTLVDQILQIIATEIGIEPDELTDDCELVDLGVDDLLAESIVSRVRELLKFDLPVSILSDHHNVDDLRTHLRSSGGGGAAPSIESQTERHGTTLPPPPPPPPLPRHNPDDDPPLSLVLQGKPQTCQKTIFLLPDGSGSGMAYARLPRIDARVCLVALNSPYLVRADGGGGAATATANFTVEGIAELWASEIQSRHQPHGPYLLGGWSAGGYYSFEVAKHLMRRGERVERLMLIDSPCRLVYEALPVEVVQYLSANRLMGYHHYFNRGQDRPPRSMLNHFDMSIRAIRNYMPTPMLPPQMGDDDDDDDPDHNIIIPPDVSIIWAEDGVLKGGGGGDGWPTELNMDVKVTRMLIERPGNDDPGSPLGWDRLFPRAKLEVATMPGNHFTIVYPPNCESLSALLRDVTVTQDRKESRFGRWVRV